MTDILGGERWTAIAEKQAAPTPGEVAFLLELSDERDRYLHRITASCRGGFADGLDQGHSDGYLAAIAEIKGVQRRLVRTLRSGSPDLSPWHLCCPACRHRGHRTGCRDCQERTRAAFADPMPGDYPGESGDLRAAG